MSHVLVLQVARICRQRHLRWTRLRADVLDLIATSPHPLKAYEVLERIRASTAITAPPTAYRVLDFLQEQGFIHKLESINAYVACRWPADVHTGVFLMCARCGSATEVIDAGTEALIRERARKLGFRPHVRTRTLEIHGVCGACGEAPQASINPREQRQQ